MEASTTDRDHAAKLRAMTLGALGVVYGDIGTSPLYTLRECLTQGGGFDLSPHIILGVLSLIFWALIITVTVKYVVFVMRADNQGEGGILALTALALRGMRPGHRRTRAVMAIGIIGAALFYGDSLITPAISVLSAVEGLKVVEPVFDEYVIPITVVILVALFVLQNFGTERVGKLFGPVMMLWFLALGTMGVSQIVQYPAVLGAVWPGHAVEMLSTHGWKGFLLLGAVVLAVTGGEALYADMGHFGRKPIRLAWFALVLPALLLCYFGQGALLLREPEAIENPFFHLAPDWAQLPLVLLATAATVIAGQAVITGAYSVTLQAMHLRYLPRMEVRHTSEHEKGQIYMPQINWVLLIGVVALVLTFKTSSNLAAAYGIAVTGTMVATTLLAYKVARGLGRWPLWQAVLAALVFLSVDAAFFLSNIIKVEDGGWFPLVIGALVFLLMAIWRAGREVVRKRLAEDALPMDSLLERLRGGSIQRVPGTAVFLTGNPRGLPPSLLHSMKHYKVLHQRVVLLTVDIDDVPHVPDEQRFELKPYSAGFYRLILHFGFKDEPDIPNALEKKKIPGLPFEPMETTYFVSRETLIRSTHTNGLPKWQEPVFIFLSKLSASPSEYFCIPPNRVVELGMQLEI
ncbi:potassium transporter Kup [Azospirillum griseum]|uniref:Probable potassium transport system protein Kup n=1 Tax=Azospirillum griseum TaxID=2496639 RepID=A0A431VPC5_9PROT|nr:potassium transporter Kup [Azospirillum griseum]RTR24615.1 potassium transporter Kup [Azospirillum griseum]